MVEMNLSAPDISISTYASRFFKFMVKQIYSSKIYVAKSRIPDAGRGVFALKEIKEGELIEVCPVVRISRDDPSNVEGGALIEYFFHFGNSQKSKSAIAVVLGYGSLYNHSYSPNATYKKKPNDLTVEFYALRKIKKDEEITVNYNYGDPNDKRKLRVHTQVPQYET